MALRLTKRFAYTTAAMFAAVGIFMLIGAADNVPPLRERDPVLGATARIVLVLAGLLHLAISVWLFTTRDLLNHGLTAVWAGLNYVIYLVGLSLLHATMPFPVIVVIAWELGISANLLFMLWLAFTAYLLISGLTLVVLDWRRLKRLELERFLARWKILREHVGSTSTRAPVAEQAPTSVLAENANVSHKSGVADFKFACEYCGQHIQCSKDYSGQQVNCPACRNLIQVPANS